MIQYNQLANGDPALAHSPLLKAALLTLDYIAEKGPIGLTPLKALKRYFVYWAIEAFEWPGYTTNDMFAFSNVVNEKDFRPLRILHDILVGTGLARHYKGNLLLGKRGRELRSFPSEIWLIVSDYLLYQIDFSDYSTPGDMVMADWNIFLSRINGQVDGGVEARSLCHSLFGSLVDPDDDLNLNYNFYFCFLRPLCWVGLLAEIETENRGILNNIFVKTPLWKAALTLPSDVHVEPVTRH